eukprot:7325667-Karenia_brevis.AAC.1
MKYRRKRFKNGLMMTILSHRTNMQLEIRSPIRPWVIAADSQYMNRNVCTIMAKITRHQC